jgi:hypothetical protein
MVRRTTRWLSGLGMAVLALLPPHLPAYAQGGQPAASRIPEKVMETLKKRFPAAEIHKWTRETENNVVLYDIEFTQQGRKLEADIKDDGSIENWERAIAAGDLPAAVRQSVEKQYPGATLSEVMAVTAVHGGKESLEGYEVVLKTAAGKDVEVTVAPDGKILEDSGAEKP